MDKGIELFIQGGPIMWPLVLMSLAAVAFAVERLLAFQQFGSTAPGLTEEAVALVRKGQAPQALDRAEAERSPVAAAIATVLRHRDQSTEDIEREVSLTEEDYFVRLERFLPWIDTFTTLSPLLGLLGTILGMVRVFQQFTATNQDESAKGQILAGVGESLYATAFGITIALFCFFCYNYFASRQRAISIRSQQASAAVLSAVNAMKAAQTGRIGANADQTGDNRRRRSRTKPGREMKKTKIEIIPMIDTMFFLLVFFILSSVGVIRLPNAVAVSLPTAQQSDVRQPGRITLSIGADGKTQINSQLPLRAGADLIAPLEREAKLQAGSRDKDIASILLVINADKNVESGTVVRAMNAAAAVGIGKVSIATDEAGSGGGG